MSHVECSWDPSAHLRDCARMLLPAPSPHNRSAVCNRCLPQPCLLARIHSRLQLQPGSLWPWNRPTPLPPQQEFLPSAVDLHLDRPRVHSCAVHRPPTPSAISPIPENQTPPEPPVTNGTAGWRHSTHHSSISPHCFHCSARSCQSTPDRSTPPAELPAQTCPAWQ